MLIDLVLGAYSDIAVTIAEEIYFRITGNRFRKKDRRTYEDRIASLMTELSKASAEVDQVLSEMQSAIRDRELVVGTLENRLSELTARKDSLEDLLKELEEKRLSDETLGQLRGIVNESFSLSERKSRRQNLAYFIAGLLLSIPIGIIVNLVSQSL